MSSRRRTAAIVLAAALAGAAGLAGCSGTPSSVTATSVDHRGSSAPDGPNAQSGTTVELTDDPEPIGDDALPFLGDRDVDVTHYDLDIRYRPDDGRLDGTAQIDLVTRNVTPNLAFDLKGMDATSVTVDGHEVGFSQADAKLRVDLPGPVGANQRLQVTVRYGGTPTPTPTRALGGVRVGWQVRDGGSFVLAEPEGARTWYPVNEHPQDKATYDIAVTVPVGVTAIANGELVGEDESTPGRRTYRWRMADPMAPYLATVVVGHYVRSDAQGPDGLPLVAWVAVPGTSYGAPGRPSRPHPGADATALLAGQRDALALLTSKLGPFPFASYGAVALSPDELEPFFNQVAIETQAMSLFGANTIEPATLVHEAAHQWMGDSVSLTDWSRDIWWVEGFARFSEWLWTEQTRGARAYEQAARSTHAELADANRSYPAGDLPLDQLFSPWSYDRGALVFYSLRAELGDETFWTAMRTFVDRYRHGNASTDDLIDVFEETSGRSLDEFFAGWLFERAVPELPA